MIDELNRFTKHLDLETVIKISNSKSLIDSILKEIKDQDSESLGKVGEILSDMFVGLKSNLVQMKITSGLSGSVENYEKLLYQVFSKRASFKKGFVEEDAVLVEEGAHEFEQPLNGAVKDEGIEN